MIKRKDKQITDDKMLKLKQSLCTAEFRIQTLFQCRVEGWQKNTDGLRNYKQESSEVPSWYFRDINSKETRKVKI